MTVTILQGDCLDVMTTLPDGCADAIIADLPYGTTACKWDTVIPFEPLWEQYKRLIKPRGAIVLFGSQLFTSALVMSNVGWFKYDWVWDKVNLFTGHLNAKRQPMRQHEEIVVFCDGCPKYNDQKRKGKPYSGRGQGTQPDNYGQFSRRNIGNQTGLACAASVLQFKGMNGESRVHPTQKPIALLEYLIRTYTNEGETVLDNTMGSGTTGVACVNTGRDFIGIELDTAYFAIAQQRIKAAQSEMVQATMFSSVAVE